MEGRKGGRKVGGIEIKKEINNGRREGKKGKARKEGKKGRKGRGR